MNLWNNAYASQYAAPVTTFVNPHCGGFTFESEEQTKVFGALICAAELLIAGSVDMSHENYRQLLKQFVEFYIE